MFFHHTTVCHCISTSINRVADIAVEMWHSWLDSNGFCHGSGCSTHWNSFVFSIHRITIILWKIYEWPKIKRVDTLFTVDRYFIYMYMFSFLCFISFLVSKIVFVWFLLLQIRTVIQKLFTNILLRCFGKLSIYLIVTIGFFFCWMMYSSTDSRPNGFFSNLNSNSTQDTLHSKIIINFFFNWMLLCGPSVLHLFICYVICMQFRSRKTFSSTLFFPIYSLLIHVYVLKVEF